MKKGQIIVIIALLGFLVSGWGVWRHLYGCSLKKEDYGKHHGRMIEKMDADADGIITKAEFFAVKERRFNALDSDKDGNLTQDEIKAYRHTKKAK